MVLDISVVFLFVFLLWKGIQLTFKLVGQKLEYIFHLYSVTSISLENLDNPGISKGNSFRAVKSNGFELNHVKNHG